MFRVAILTLAASVFLGSGSLEEEAYGDLVDRVVQFALDGDDQCNVDGMHDPECAIKALQIKAEELTEANDISAKFFATSNSSILKLQPYVIKEWTALMKLEQICATTMAQMENITGEPVVWNAGNRGKAEHGRRRRRTVGKKLPRKTKYIMKLIEAVRKEMHQYWNKYAIVDRKRIGILNEIRTHPYGPTRAVAALAEASVDEEVHESAEDIDDDEKPIDDDDVPEQKTNKEMIEDNYMDLIRNIKDARNHTANLTTKIDSAVAQAKTWMASTDE